VPEVLTVLRIDMGPDHPDAARVRAVAGEAGATAIVNGGATTVVAAFPFASDAANAVLRLAGAAAGPSGVPRMRLSTGEAVMQDGEVSGPARDRVDALAAVGGEAAVLMTASTAVMVHHTLPPGAELVDRGVVALGPQRAERIYELRTGPGVRGPDDDAAASNLGWARRAATRVMVGREAHVAHLEAAWAAALTGERRVVVLAGDPGIGKTTVAAELALRVHAGGGIVLYGRWDEEGLAPYQALREALGSYAAACPRALLRADLSVRADEVARLLPEIAAHIGGVRPPLAEDPEAERLRLFDAVRDWLGAIAARRPLLLVLDDLQWADRSSLRLLRHILDAPPADPLLVVLTRRDGDAQGLGPLHALGSLAGVDIERIEVAGLDPEAVTELVVRAIGRPVDDDEAAVSGWLAEETAGNPLYVHEILAGLDPDDPAAALRQVREHLPDRVHDVVRWRLSRLAPGVTDVLGAASLIGEEFPLDVLSAVVDVRPLDLRNQLDDATRAGVVRDVGERRVAFAHAVVRRALQDELAPERATALHRRIGEALADRNHGGEGAPAAEIAHHLLVSADAATAGRAVRWARAAADHARRETAFENAVWFLTRAIDLLDRFPPDRDVELTADTACELRLEAAEAHDRAGEFAARDRRYLEAADLAQKLGRADLFVRAALGYGGRLPAVPPPNPTARALLEQARLLLPPRDSRALALTLARLAHVIYSDSGHDERLALAAEAEAMARRLDAPVVLASVLCSRMLAVDGPDDVEDHLETGAEVIRIGEQTGDADVVLQGARARVQALFTVGAHDAARDLAERFAGLADTVRHPDHLRLATMWQVMWAILEGRFAEGEARASELRQRLEQAGHPQVLTIYFAEVFVALWMQGRLPEIIPVLDAGIQLDPDALDTWAVRTWALAGVGDTAGAQESLRVHPGEELAAFDRSFTWLVAVVGAAVGAVATGDEVWAAAAHTALLPYSGRNCVLGHAAYLGAVDHHLGVLDLVLGRHDDAVDRLTQGLDRHRVIGARPWAALSGAWLANALSERGGRGDAARAAALDTESRDLAAELGVEALPPPHAALSG
jgi:tetratricopeptide (TPR) repeat protein